MILIPILAAVLIMLASLGGVLFAHRGLASFFQKNTTIMTSFAIGVFLIVVYTLFREARHEGLSFALIFLWGLSGAVFLEMISRIVPHAHHHHGTPHQEHDHSPLEAKRLILGDAIHNVGDGVILVPAFLIDIRVGIATTIGIFFHELVQEIAEFFILRKAGYSVKRALTFNFLASSTILLGVALSLMFVHAEESLAPLLAISGGGFLYVILRDLLPDTMYTVHFERKVAPYLAAVIFGALIMLAVNLIIPHEHASHDDHNEHDHTVHAGDHDDDHEDEDSHADHDEEEDLHDHEDEGDHEDEHEDHDDHDDTKNMDDDHNNHSALVPQH